MRHYVDAAFVLNSFFSVVVVAFFRCFGGVVVVAALISQFCFFGLHLIGFQPFC